MTEMAITDVLIQGDLSALNEQQKLSYYLKVCDSLGLNPYTKPFAYLKLQGVETLYARKDATDQLRKLNKVSITDMDKLRDGDLYIVTAYAKTADGRQDVATGAVNIKNLYGDPLANAIMRAETKAKRRVTLSICGLGLTDESELDQVSGAVTSVPELPPAPDGPPDPPIRERDVQDAPRPRPEPLITSADDRVWKRWEDVRDDALKFGIVPPTINLPVGRSQLVSQATFVKAQIEAKQAQLAREDAARRQAQVGGQSTSESSLWERNKALMDELYAAGFHQLRELPAEASAAELAARNEELIGLLQRQA